MVTGEYLRQKLVEPLKEKQREERLAAEREFAKIGLAVGTDNPRARALYERLGYVDTGFGVFEIGGTYTDIHGSVREWREVCEYLVKGLD